MVTIGNFFYRYRNFLFIFLYLALFIPSPKIFRTEQLGEQYYLWPIVIGLIITVTGQAIRGGTIGLAYIIRGGTGTKVFADKLVTQGIFHHCRNPLYVGNILMLAGVGILSNSLLFMGFFIPLFLFIYQTIVRAEENFLRNKFGADFEAYCARVNRWLLNPSGLGQTFDSMEFKPKRWVLKEYNTQFVWLLGITVILLMYYPQVTHYNSNLRNALLVSILLVLAGLYLTVRYLKKSGKWVAD